MENTRAVIGGTLQWVKGRWGFPCSVRVLKFGTPRSRVPRVLFLDVTQEGRLRPDFERAVRRLFRIYDMDRDGVLSDNELNTFQYDAYQLYLSEEDIVALKRVGASIICCILYIRRDLLKGGGDME